MHLFYCPDCRQMTNHACCKCGEAENKIMQTALEEALTTCIEDLREAEKKNAALEKELDEARVSINSHGYALDVLRRKCGLKSGDNYQDVYDRLTVLEAVAKVLHSIYKIRDQCFIPNSENEIDEAAFESLRNAGYTL